MIYLSVGKLPTGNSKHNLSNCDQQVLNELESDRKLIFLYYFRQRKVNTLE